MKRIIIPIIAAGLLLLAACANPTIPESPSASPASAAPVQPPPPAPAGTFKPPFWLIGTWTTKNNSLSIQVTKDNIIRRKPPLGTTEDLSKAMATTKDGVALRVTEHVGYAYHKTLGRGAKYTISASKRISDRWGRFKRYDEIKRIELRVWRNGALEYSRSELGSLKETLWLWP